MRIVLDSDVNGIGKKHELKDVSPGYARNFLFPNKLARQLTPALEKEILKIKDAATERDLENQKHLKELASKIAGRNLVFEIKTDEKGSAFGSVNKEMILSGLRNAKLVTKEHLEIVLDHPLKSIGDHEVEIDLKKGIKTRLTITLRPQS